jgi:hypothetical protein
MRRGDIGSPWKGSRCEDRDNGLGVFAVKVFGENGTGEFFGLGSKLLAASIVLENVFSSSALRLVSFLSTLMPLLESTYG